MKTITVRVTSEDIKRGKPQSDTKCPVALAIKRTGLLNVCVCNEQVYFKRFRKFFVSYFPSCVKTFINKFDDSEFDERIHFKPFNFSLKVPTRSVN